MLKKFDAGVRAKNRHQAFALLLMGIVCLLVAWLVHPDSSVYPVGVMVLGIGMLIGVILNPYRLMIASLLVALVGVAVFLAFKGLIPGNQALPAYIIAMGLGLIVIALMTQRGYIGKGAITPGVIVLVVGIIEALLAAGRTPAGFIPFMLSFWLPGIGLVVLGLAYLATS